MKLLGDTDENLLVAIELLPDMFPASPLDFVDFEHKETTASSSAGWRARARTHAGAEV